MMAAPSGGSLTGIASIEAVLRLAKHVPVFPCRRRDEHVVVDGRPKTLKAKAPYTNRGFHDASQEEVHIRTWWREWPDALVGVPTGQTTRLVVIDWDPAKHADTTGEWIQENAEVLLSARIHRTNRGGRHYLFRLAPRLRYRSGTDIRLGGVQRPGLDLRGEGGYIIWWPLHGGEITNDSEQAPLLPAGLLDDQLEVERREQGPLPQYSPIKWQHDKQFVVDALGHLDPDCDRNQWRDIGMAIHLATQGSEDGFNVWHAWSSGGITGEMPAKYAGIDSCREMWASFKLDPHKSVRLGTIFHLAEARGYTLPKASRSEPPPFDEIPPELEHAAVSEHETEGTESEEEVRIEARIFEWVAPTSIPPRQWLFAQHYMRGMVSATAGVGGAGKSTLLNVELVSMAIGRDLLRGGKEIPLGPMVAWGHNGEDPYEELQRRVMAVCQHYGVTRENLGERLRITSGRDMPIMVARKLTDGGKLLVPTEDGKRIAAEIQKHKIQVFIADPFVTIHRVDENDNVQIDGVMTILRDLAHESQAAIEVAHHFRKLNGDDANVDALRGASSLVGACRSVRICASMSKDEATKYGIDDEQRGFYSWLQNGKANMLPPTHKRHWMFMTSVNLGNAQGPYKADEIGVTTEWTPPDADSDLTPPEFRSVRRAIQEANPLTALRCDVRAAGWIGLLIARTLERDESDKVVRAQMQSIVNRFTSLGYLKREDVRDHGKGRNVPVLLWQKGGEES